MYESKSTLGQLNFAKDTHRGQIANRVGHKVNLTDLFVVHGIVMHVMRDWAHLEQIRKQSFESSFSESSNFSTPDISCLGNHEVSSRLVNRA